ncbi:MAG TPA: DUF5665 domain-containing protein [Candidatus Paceibacterota bacterium]|nr:DUF5665 domain-containing protein [Candidatus Paceibacterota bacterium]
MQPRVEERIEEIHDAVVTPWYVTLMRGLWQGIGIVIGTVLAIALLGWILSLFGVIPGFSEIAEQLKSILHARY